MAIARLLDDLAIIQKQSDDPVKDQSLSVDEFKGEFDKAALIIQQYINDILAPAIDAINTGAIIISNTKPDVTPALWFDTSGHDDGSASVKYVNTIGDVTVISPGTKLSMVSGLQEELDSIRKPLTAVQVTLLAANWSATAPYVQTVSVSGMTSAWTPGDFKAIPTGTTATDITIREEMNYIGSIASGSGTLTFKCLEDKPTVNMTLRISGVLT